MLVELEPTLTHQNKLFVRKRVNIMFVVIGGLIVAAIFTVSGMLYTHSDKRLAIWTFFIGSVVTLFIGCKVWADSVTTGEQNNEGKTMEAAPLPNPGASSKATSPTVTPAETSKDMSKQPDINITSHDQKGGFTGINTGTLNMGASTPVPISFPDDKVELLKSLLAVPTIESIDFARYDDAASETLYNKLRYAFGSWKVPHLDIVTVNVPPFESGVTVKCDAQQSTQVDTIVKALRDVGLPSRKLDIQNNGGKVTIVINGLQ